MPSPIRLIIADDHAVFRQGLTSLLLVQDDMRVVGEADCADRVLQPLSLTHVMSCCLICRWTAGSAKRSKSSRA